MSSWSCLRWLEKGNRPPNCSIFALRGEASHNLTHSVLSSDVYFCLSAEALARRGLLSKVGKLIIAFEQPKAAIFANLSMVLLPLTLLWLEIHLICSLHVIVFVAVLRLLIKYWPGAAL